MICGQVSGGTGNPTPATKCWRHRVQTSPFQHPTAGIDHQLSERSGLDFPNFHVANSFWRLDFYLIPLFLADQGLSER